MAIMCTAIAATGPGTLQAVRRKAAAAHMMAMLEDNLFRFTNDETCIVLHLSQELSMENPVVSNIGASADRVDECGNTAPAAVLRGYFNDIQAYDRRDVLTYMDEHSAGLEDLAAAAYPAAEEQWSSHILAIESVEAFGADRGTGLALLLVAATLESLSRGRLITAVLEPCPLNPQGMSKGELTVATKKLRAHWRKLGFKRVSRTSRYMVLNTENYQTPERVLCAQ